MLTRRDVAQHLPQLAWLGLGLGLGLVERKPERDVYEEELRYEERPEGVGGAPRRRAARRVSMRSDGRGGSCHELMSSAHLPGRKCTYPPRHSVQLASHTLPVSREG